MGIKGISKLIKQFGTQRNLQFYSSKKIAIDTSIFLYKFKYHNENVIPSFRRQFLEFRKYNITPIYVFDGDHPIEKQVTKDKRKSIKADLISKLEETDCEKSKKIIKKRIINITKDDSVRLKELFDENNISYIQSDTEGEKHCALLNISGDADLVLSNDYDSLTFGCKTLLTSSMIEYSLDKILEGLEIDYNLYVDLCISCGCDYYPEGISRIGPITGLKKIKQYGLLENWKDTVIPEDLCLDNLRRIFGSKSQCIIE